jgi:hypothetical protein
MAITDRPQQVSADEIRLVGESFESPITTLNGAFHYLQTGVAAIGTPWGDDETGTLFSSVYLPAQSQTFEMMTSVNGGLTDLKTGFLTMADNYEATENANNQ